MAWELLAVGEGRAAAASAVVEAEAAVSAVAEGRAVGEGPAAGEDLAAAVRECLAAVLEAVEAVEAEDSAGEGSTSIARTVLFITESEIPT